MAEVIRKYPGLGLLAGATMLAAFFNFGVGISSAQPISVRPDRQQQDDALPKLAAKHAESMAAVKPSAPGGRSDVRRATVKGPYYVDFRARTAATYGHAFVWYGKTSEKQVEVAGLAPAGDELPYILGHLIFVPSETGASYGDLDEQYLTASYRVYLNEADAKKVFAYIKPTNPQSLTEMLGLTSLTLWRCLKQLYLLKANKTLRALILWLFLGKTD